MLTIRHERRSRRHHRIWAEEWNSTSSDYSLGGSGVCIGDQHMATMGCRSKYELNQLFVLCGKDHRRRVADHFNSSCKSFVSLILTC